MMKIVLLGPAWQRLHGPGFYKIDGNYYIQSIVLVVNKHWDFRGFTP